MIGVQGDTTSAVDHSSGVKGPQKLKYVVFTTSANPVNPNDALKSREKRLLVLQIGRGEFANNYYCAARSEFSSRNFSRHKCGLHPDESYRETTAQQQ